MTYKSGNSEQRISETTVLPDGSLEVLGQIYKG